MTELEFLERQQALAADRVERALLGDGLESRVAALENAAVHHPWLTVGAAAVVGSLVGAVLGRSSGRKLLARLSRLAGRPVWRAVRRGLA